MAERVYRNYIKKYHIDFVKDSDQMEMDTRRLGAIGAHYHVELSEPGVICIIVVYTKGSKAHAKIRDILFPADSQKKPTP